MLDWLHILSTAIAYLCIIDAKHFLNDPHPDKNAIKLQAMQDAPPLQLYPASDKFLMWNQRKAAKYL